MCHNAETSIAPNTPPYSCRVGKAQRAHQIKNSFNAAKATQIEVFELVGTLRFAHPTFNPDASQRLHNKSGFTLLEILIALFVFTIIAMIMVGALHTALTTQAGTEKSAARFNHIEITTLLLSRDLEQIIDRPIINAAGSSEPSLYGSNTEIKFTHAGLANPFWELNRSTLQRTHYFLRKNSLIRETWPELDQTRHTLSSHRVLLKNVADLRFQYLDDKGKFQNTWPIVGQTQTGLPRAVRVFITIKNMGKISQLYVIAGQSLGPQI